LAEHAEPEYEQLVGENRSLKEWVSALEERRALLEKVL